MHGLARCRGLNLRHSNKLCVKNPMPVLPTSPARPRHRCLWPVCLVILLLSLILPATATAQPRKAPSQASTAAQADLVVVMKARRKLYLYRRGMILASYPVALGLDPSGTKRQEGDNKTPIGAYTLDWRNPDSRFHRSLHISYPNAEDRAQAKARGVPPGGDIMIHGQPSYDNVLRTGDWTDGCIAVSDQHIEQIWTRVPAGTPIHIYP